MEKIQYRLYVNETGERLPVRGLLLDEKKIAVADADGSLQWLDASVGTLEMSNGAKDSTGRTLFENDIIRVRHSMVENVPPYEAVVRFHEGNFNIKPLDTKEDALSPMWETLGILANSGLSAFGKTYEWLRYVDSAAISQ